MPLDSHQNAAAAIIPEAAQGSAIAALIVTQYDSSRAMNRVLVPGSPPDLSLRNASLLI